MIPTRSDHKRVVILTIAHRGDDVRLYHKLGLSLAKQFEVIILTPVQAGLVNEPNYRTIHIEGNNRVDLLYKLFRSACMLNPDIVICIEPQTMIPALLVRRYRQSALIYDCHEFYGDSFGERFPKQFQRPAKRFYEVMENLLARQMDGIIAVNDVIANRFRKCTKNLATCPNYMIPQDSVESVDEKKFDLVYAGGMLIEKGILVILNAIALLKDRFPDIRALFLGKFYTDETKQAFFGTIERLGIARHIHFGGQVSHTEAMKAIESARFGVVMMDPRMSRYWNSLPLKFMEFLYAGLPVVAQNMPIMRSVVDEHAVGACVDFDAESVAEAMTRLLSLSEAERIEMGRRATVIAQDEFIWSRIEPRLLSLTEMVLERRMLLFAYFYPPLGASGVQRPCKMVHYLKQAGITTDVISVKDIVFHSHDHKMLGECGHRRLIRTRSLDPMSILKRLVPSRKSQDVYFNTAEWKKRLVRGIQPIDDKIGWLPFALAAVLRIKPRPSVVAATTGPYTGGLAALLYSYLTGVPLALDYRDSYTDHPYIGFLTPLHRALAIIVERAALRRAFLVSTAAEDMKEKLISRYGEWLRNKTLNMYNGWDPRDFAENLPENPNDGIVRFHYLGNFYGLQRVEYFIRALVELKREKRLPNDVRFTFTGNYFAETMQALQSPDLASIIQVESQVEHHEAIERMIQSDALLLFVATPGGKGVLTGKVFEYLRTGREILAMVPTDGEVAGILRDCGYHDICAMEDIASIKENFLRIYERVKAGASTAHNNIDKYSRESQLRHWIDMLRKRV